MLLNQQYYIRKVLMSLLPFLISQIAICCLFSYWITINYFNLYGLNLVERLFFTASDILVIGAAIASIIAVFITKKKTKYIALFLLIVCTLCFAAVVVYDNMVVERTPFGNISYTLFSVFVIINSICSIKLVLNSKVRLWKGYIFY